MKRFYITLLFLIFLFFSCTKETQSNLIRLDSNIPTGTPQVFGEGIISTDSYEFAITFTPEMDEIYFTRRKPGEPHISPKGDKLYFGSTRPLNDTIGSTGLHQWYSKRQENGWSLPIPLEKPFVDKSIIMYLTSSENGNLYFTTGEKGDKPEDWVIYNSIMEDGQYKTIKRMGKEINATGKWVAHSYIAPDESYMIYDFKSDSGYGESDLYISFNKNGSRTEPFNLGPKVNTDQTEMAASVSPDGKYLFFHRGGDDKGDIYWLEFEPIKKEIEKAKKQIKS